MVKTRNPSNLIMENPTILALIVARAGSKGIIDKNIQPIGDIPMLAHSVLAAKDSRYIQEIIISTDSEQYAQIAVQYGAKAPFIRPPELASDTASSNQVIAHALTMVSADIIVLLQATSPLRLASDIDNAVQLFLAKNADVVYSVQENVKHPNLFRYLEPDAKIHNYQAIPNELAHLPRQNYEKIYALNGAIYVFRADYFLRHGNFLSQNAYGYIMPAERSIDIDTPFDLMVARAIWHDNN